MGHTFEQAVLRHLEIGESEAYALSDAALPALARALDVSMRRRSALAEVQRALSLAAAFDDELASPSVARHVRTLLRAHPVAMHLIQTQVLEAQGLDEVRRFARREGRTIALDAPLHDGPCTSDGAVKLADFLDPAGGIGVPRVVRRDR